MFFCSDNCQKKFNNKSSATCPFRQQKYPQDTGVYFKEDPETVFCSEECAFAWKRDKKNPTRQRDDFITENLKTLSGWNLPSEEEKSI